MGHLEDELGEYFGSAERTAGLRSAHGALVNMAMSGACGTRSPRSPDGAWDDDRIRSVGRGRLVQEALRVIDPRPRDVLFCAFVPFDWTRVVATAFGSKNDAAELTVAIGRNTVGVALLTDVVRDGFTAERDKIGRSGPVWDSELGWLMSWVIQKEKDLLVRRAEVLRHVKTGSALLLRSALTIYAEARGLEPPPAPERPDPVVATRSERQAPRRTRGPSWYEKGEPPPTPRFSSPEAVA